MEGNKQYIDIFFSYDYLIVSYCPRIVGLPRYSKQPPFLLNTNQNEVRECIINVPHSTPLSEYLIYGFVGILDANKRRGIRWRCSHERWPKPREKRLDPARLIQTPDDAREGWIPLHGL